MTLYNVTVSFDIRLDCNSEESARRIGEEKADSVSGWHDAFGGDWDSWVQVESVEVSE